MGLRGITPEGGLETKARANVTRSKDLIKGLGFRGETTQNHGKQKKHRPRKVKRRKTARSSQHGSCGDENKGPPVKWTKRTKKITELYPRLTVREDHKRTIDKVKGRRATKEGPGQGCRGRTRTQSEMSTQEEFAKNSAHHRFR